MFDVIYKVFFCFSGVPRSVFAAILQRYFFTWRHPLHLCVYLALLWRLFARLNFAPMFCVVSHGKSSMSVHLSDADGRVVSRREFFGLNIMSASPSACQCHFRNSWLGSAACQFSQVWRLLDGAMDALHFPLVFLFLQVAELEKSEACSGFLGCGVVCYCVLTFSGCGWVGRLE